MMMRSLVRNIGLATLPLLLWGSVALLLVTSTYAAVDGNYIYEDIDADTVTITGYTELSESHLVIPATIAGKRVVEISNHSFWVPPFGGNRLTIEEGVIRVGHQAFYRNSLTDVTLPSTVTDIGEGAFWDNQLTSVTLPENLTKISDSSFGGNNLTSIIIPNSVTEIEYRAFQGNQLTQVIIPSHVNKLWSDAFSDNSLQAVLVLNRDLEYSEKFTEGFSQFANNPAGLTLYGYAGSTTEAYAEDHGHAFSAITAALADLEIDIPGLTFDSGDYAYDLATASNAISVTATSSNPFAELEINNTVVDSGTSSGPISLHEGPNTITVDVTIPDGVTEAQYVLNVRMDSIAPAIGLTADPTSATNGDITVNVVAIDTGSGVNEIKWAAGNQGTAFFATDGETVVGNAFTVTANGTYTVYARDNAGNETVELITIGNIDRNAPTIGLTASPTGSTNGNVTVTVDAQASSGIGLLKWAAGTQGTPFFATDGEAVVGNAFIVTANGTYTVYARDNAGNETVEPITIGNIVRSTSSATPTPPDSPKDPDPRTTIAIGPGVILIEVAPRDIKELPKDDGGVKEVVNLPDDVWERIPELLDEVDRPMIRVIVNDKLPDVEMNLPGKRLAELMDVNPKVEFDMQLNGSSFQLKVNVLGLEQLAAQLGIAVDDLNVSIRITALSGQAKDDFVLTAKGQGMSLLSEVIEFQLVVSASDEWVEISDFGGTYMTKSIVLDEQFANRNYMAVLYDPNSRTFTYVPAIMARVSKDRQDAVLQMPHNSIYAVVEAERIEFADMQGHWAESETEHLGTKRIIKGITNNDYAPSRNVTRAEFASLLVRALGIKTDRSGTGDVFEDVAAASWYSAEVETAFKAGLVDGISSTDFAPEAQITREQIAVMLMNAHAIVNDRSDSIEPIPYSLAPYTDASEVSAWARDAMTEAVAKKLIEGMSTDRLAPSAPATRAQAAVMLHRFMVMIEFLD